eukprot:gene7-biopygen19539
MCSATWRPSGGDAGGAGSSSTVLASLDPPHHWIAPASTIIGHGRGIRVVVLIVTCPCACGALLLCCTVPDQCSSRVWYVTMPGWRQSSPDQCDNRPHKTVGRVAIMSSHGAANKWDASKSVPFKLLNTTDTMPGGYTCCSAQL